MPYTLGGEATVENISLRCRDHNVYESERIFGPYDPARVRETPAVHGRSMGSLLVPGPVRSPPRVGGWQAADGQARSGELPNWLLNEAVRTGTADAAAFAAIVDWILDDPGAEVRAAAAEASRRIEGK